MGCTRKGRSGMYELAKASLNSRGNEIIFSERKNREGSPPGTTNDENDDPGKSYA